MNGIWAVIILGVTALVASWIKRGKDLQRERQGKEIENAIETTVKGMDTAVPSEFHIDRWLHATPTTGATTSSGGKNGNSGGVQ